ncbi:MAG: Gfo/Idh/MocA family oxidoreductase, partial [Candidatus Methylomirabilis sp.]|nr:Gfo/Idh/MocA family oxidoreductase [Deltaproteobacteria bacterium]
IGVAILGSGWISGVHVQALRTVPGAEVVANWSPTPEKRRAFAEQWRIARTPETREALLALPEVDLVCVNTPNALHAEAAVAAMEAGKHVIVEKPLATTLEDAARIREVSARTGRIVGYAEELCFVPKFLEAKRLVESGALGKVYRVKQSEKHGGAYSPWFFEADAAGGGILMDMGCHSIEFARWLLGKPRALSVYAEMSTQVTPRLGVDFRMDDDLILIVEFEGGASALLESSWCRQGGMESATQILGTEGVLDAPLLLEGTGMRMFSLNGTPDKPFESRGWSFPDWEWLWQNGYPQEMAHFVECARAGKQPSEGAEDGEVVLEIMLAAYQSAGTGRKVSLPFRPKGVKRPVDLWKKPV